jgi:hypothetical protein
MQKMFKMRPASTECREHACNVEVDKLRGDKRLKAPDAKPAPEPPGEDKANLVIY